MSRQPSPGAIRHLEQNVLLVQLHVELDEELDGLLRPMGQMQHALRVAGEQIRRGSHAGLHVVAVPNPSTHEHDFAAAHLVLPSLAAAPLPQLLARFGAEAQSAPPGL